MILILLVGFVYFYNLGSAPNGMLVDEPAFAYSAYSVLLTGHDEHGKFLPLVFESYGDQKMPLYVYTMVPLIALFGLTTAVARMPAALAALALVPVYYFILRELRISKRVSLVATLIMAISPFSFFMARLGRESTLGLLFFALSVLFLLKAIGTKRTLFWVLTAVSALLSWYSYVAYRFVTLLFFPVVLAVLYYRKAVNLKQIGMMSVVAAVLIVPLLLAGNVGTSRLKQVGFANDPGPLMKITEERNYCGLYLHPKLCAVSANKVLVYGQILTQRLIGLYSPEYLFSRGDKEQLAYSIPDFGQFYLITLPFFAAGLYYLLKNRRTNAVAFLVVLVALFTTPIPSILAGDVNKMRVSASFVFLFIVVAFGFEYVFTLLPRKRLYLGALVVAAGVGVQSYMFYVNFFTIHTTKYEILYNSHVRQLAGYLQKYDSTTAMQIEPFFSDPLMFYAFYMKTDPETFQRETRYLPADEIGFRHAQRLGSVQVGHVEPKDLVCLARESGKLLVYVSDKKLETVRPVFVAKSTNGVHEMGYVYEITPELPLIAPCNESI